MPKVHLTGDIQPSPSLNLSVILVRDRNPTQDNCSEFAVSLAQRLMHPHEEIDRAMRRVSVAG